MEVSPLEIHILQKKLMQLLGCGVVFGIILLLNHLTPAFNYDNYFYATGITSVSDIFVALHRQWMTWCGRCVAHFFTHFFMMFDKFWFNLCNSFMYMLFSGLMYVHAIGRNRAFSLRIYLLMNIMLWYFLRAWGSCIMWLDGSCNYLWTSSICLLFLLPYRFKLTETSYHLNCAAIGMFLLGICSGCSNENTGFAILTATFLYVWRGKSSGVALETWEWSGIGGFLLGFVFLMAAPGNYLRAGSLPAIDKIFSALVHNFSVCLMMLDRAARGIVCFIVLMLLYGRQKMVRESYVAFGYVFLALVSHFAMIASPEYPCRSTMSVVFFSIIGLCNLIERIDFGASIIRNKFLKIIYLCVLFHFPWSLYEAIEDARATKQDRDRILAYILAEKAKGRHDVIMEQPLSPKNMHTGDYLCCPVSTNPNNWVNRAYSNYFAVRSIRATK
jgi:hypothetical protein